MTRAGRQSGAVTMLGTGTTVAAPQTLPRGRGAQKPPKTAVGTDRDATRILGLDLALNVTGWCMLAAGQPEAHGTFHLPERGKNQPIAVWLNRRAVELGRQVGLLISMHRPEVVGYEFPDMARPTWSGGSKGREFSAVQGLSRAEGFLVALWPSIGRGARLVSVPMTEAKRAAAGRPGATKDQVAFGLRTYRGFDLTGWGPDEVDALAVAVAAREAL